LNKTDNVVSLLTLNSPTIKLGEIENSIKNIMKLLNLNQSNFVLNNINQYLFLIENTLEKNILNPYNNLDLKSDLMIKNKKIPENTTVGIVKKICKKINFNFKEINSKNKKKIIQKINVTYFKNLNYFEKKKKILRELSHLIKLSKPHELYRKTFNNIDKFNSNYYKIWYLYTIKDFKLKLLFNLLEILFLNFIVLISDAEYELKIYDPKSSLKNMSKKVIKSLSKIYIKKK